MVNKTNEVVIPVEELEDKIAPSGSASVDD